MEPKYLGQFVNVYLVDRRYGGPEEGGWYYDVGTAVSSEEVLPVNVLTVAQAKRTGCLVENEGRPPVSSVRSIGRYIVVIEDTPARDYPTERPHYE